MPLDILEPKVRKGAYQAIHCIIVSYSIFMNPLVHQTAHNPPRTEASTVAHEQRPSEQASKHFHVRM